MQKVLLHCWFEQKIVNTYRILITAAKNISFDENYSMLKAIYSSLSNFSTDEEGIYLEVCDAVLNICHYMGQESYEMYGKGILETLRYSGYSTKIQKQEKKYYLKNQKSVLLLKRYWLQLLI